MVSFGGAEIIASAYAILSGLLNKDLSHRFRLKIYLLPTVWSSFIGYRDLQEREAGGSKQPQMKWAGKAKHWGVWVVGVCEA